MTSIRPYLTLLAGPLSAAILLVSLPSSFADAEMKTVTLAYESRIVIAVTSWIAIWWITEAIPLAVTALLPLVIFPFLGLTPFKTAAQSYAHPLIFLFLGGFLVSTALQKWDVHRRFAVSLLRRVGSRPDRLVGGFMVATAFLSMWLSNTATTIMMLPIALSVVDTRADNNNVSKCLLLSIAYSASIGGMATIIGTPPNLYVASYFNEVLGKDIGFLKWMAVGLPCVAVLLPVAWFYLTRVHFSLPQEPGAGLKPVEGRGLVWADLGRGARATLVVFLFLVIGWVGRPWISEWEIMGTLPFADLSDAGIALVAACALFVIPTDIRNKKFVLDWPDTINLPWGTLLLFGGGLCLAATVNATGTDQILGQWIARLPAFSPVLLMIAIVALVIFLTELTSNIATTATLVPVLAAAAPLLGLDGETVVVAVALAASCAFMLPVATPPNAIVFSSGQIRAPEMALAGVSMNFIALAVICSVGYLLVPYALR